MHADDFFATVDRIGQAKTESDVLGLLREVATRSGYEHFIVSGLPPRGVNVLPFVLAEDWPVEWHERYFGRDYTQFDPVARYCFNTTMPFFWNDAPFDHDDRPAQRVMDEAGDVGLRAGLCVPVHGEDGSQGCVSFGGTANDISPDDQLGVHLVSFYAHGRLRGFRRGDVDRNPMLTKREVEVLKWVSYGKTSADIADVLNITERTVIAHIKNASTKLNTLNRVHTVAEAMRYNLLPL